MSQVAQIRAELLAILQGVSGLGGTNPSPELRNLHPYFYHADDKTEFDSYWVTTEDPSDPDTERTVNGAMISRTARDDTEPVEGREFSEGHRMQILFRYGRKQDPLAERTFEEMLEGIMDAIQGNAIFKRNGLHPGALGDQTATSAIVKETIFGMRVFKATIELTVYVTTLTDQWQQS